MIFYLQVDIIVNSQRAAMGTDFFFFFFQFNLTNNLTVLQVNVAVQNPAHHESEHKMDPDSLTMSEQWNDSIMLIQHNPATMCLQKQPSTSVFSTFIGSWTHIWDWIVFFFFFYSGKLSELKTYTSNKHAN